MIKMFSYFLMMVLYVMGYVYSDQPAELAYQSLKDEVHFLRERLGAVEAELMKRQKETDCNSPGKRFVEEQDIETEVIRLRGEVNKMRQEMGSTYVRWGRTTCPGNTTLVYKGYMGGNVYTDNGGPANYLCLPEDPTWGKYEDGIQNEGNKIYGSEYEHHGNFNPFDKNMMDEDVPCAVCSTKRSMNIMLPARTQCHTGWHLEYTGYLMTVSSGHPAAGEYICMDGHPESILHGSANTNGNVLYLVEAVCGTLPCLPYVDGRELTCSVCSK
ncbi:short-chain collagen C4-like [Mercenaria mercenaria]|uniref:short-chain collagen C4-like n=1 Tax=Mercenaria mercenaria TaxID=6596 RepID=UPI00234EE8E7|nr:short-chain collagen C4-like [Mercenaria mercenaria]